MASLAPLQACFVCVNTSCRGRGSVEILRRLAEGLAGTAVQLREQICFGACWMGPNIVVHPKGTWYCGVGLQDVTDILSHLKGGLPVARLMDDSDPALHDQVIETLKSTIG